MATRVTASEVKVIIDTSLSDGDVDSFINSANIMVNNILGDEDLNEDLLTEIEKWYTAHLIAVSRDRQAQSETVDNASIRYAGQYGTNLNMTSYGQTVKQLDTSGRMAKVGEKQAGLWSIKSSY